MIKYMRRVNLLVLLVGVLFFIPVTSAKATTITVLTDSDDVGPTETDFQSATEGSLYSNSTTYYNDIGARAAASTNGSLAVSTSAGGADHNYFMAQASWAETYTNPFGCSSEYFLNLNIGEGILYMNDTINHFDIGKAYYEISVLLEGNSVWSSSATMTGGFNWGPPDLPDVTLSLTGTNLDGTLNQWADESDYLGFFASYSIPEYDELLNLGLYSPGDSFTLEYVLTVGLLAGEAAKSYALFGDALNLQTAPGISGSVSACPVPEPSTILLLGSGLLGFAGFRKKSKKHNILNRYQGEGLQWGK